VAAGHRRIAFVSGRQDIETGAARLDGYQLTMRAHGLEPLVVEGNFRTDEARAAVERLLASDKRPTALIAANNMMTLGAFRAVHDARIDMPGELALVAFDDPSWAALVEPPLTTFAQPVRRMATEATELLLERVAGGRTEPRRTVHPFVLRRRASCGTCVTVSRFPDGSHDGVGGI
jgi:DNA-binding LacI/PurR family transcriptional regulator